MELQGPVGLLLCGTSAGHAITPCFRGLNVLLKCSKRELNGLNSWPYSLKKNKARAPLKVKLILIIYVCLL